MPLKNTFPDDCTGTEGHKGEEHCTLVLSDGDTLQVQNTGAEQVHFVLVAGKPLKEPIVQRGKLLEWSDLSQWGKCQNWGKFSEWGKLS